ncbi:hypothetical protein HQ590_03720 [bacterium]|nr:hypothetical protein [bacterium]
MTPCRFFGVLDDRLEGQRDLVGLQRRSILLPADQRFRPKPEALVWRVSHLLKMN